MNIVVTLSGLEVAWKKNSCNGVFGVRPGS